MRKVLIIFLIVAMLAGCSAPEAAAPSPEATPARAKATEPPKAAPGRELTAENEIFTYRKLDPAKTTIVVSRTGNTYIEGFSRAFEEKNPDVQVVCLDITGGNSIHKPLKDWVLNGDAPDIMFATTGNFEDEFTLEHFENLSANPAVSNYQTEALNRAAVNANIYWLPGPSKINCMMYNKTLFAQYGWETPKTFDEFIELCLKIKEDTNGEVEPWNPNAKYDNDFTVAMEGLIYEEVFGGLENYTWYMDFIAGEAQCGDRLDPFYEVLERLMDNGLISEGHFSYSATTRGKEFEEGRIAMLNYPVTLLDNEQFEFGFFPFPGTAGEVGYLSDYFSCIVGVPKKERSAAEKDAVQRYIEFFSSEEGQRAFIGDALMVSNVKNVELAAAEHLAELQEAIDQGHMFAIKDFKGGAAGAPTFSLYSHAASIVKGEKTIEESKALIEEQPFVVADEAPQAPPEAIATVAEDFSILETSCFFADMYREKAGADIGLITNNLAYRGNLMRMYKGELTGSHVNTLKPRSLGNDAALIKASMTGEQLLAALNDPVGYERTEDCIYAFSGLKCEVAPWNKLGEKYISVALSDGTPIDPAKLYTVAFWAGTVYDKYITETLETYEGTWEELMTAKLSAASPIAPEDGERIKLVWE